MPVKFHACTHTHNYSFTPGIVAHAFGGLGLIMSVQHCSTHMHSLVTSVLTIVQQPTLRRDFPWFISHVQNHVLARRAAVPAAAAAAAQVATSPLPSVFWAAEHIACVTTVFWDVTAYSLAATFRKKIFCLHCMDTNSSKVSHLPDSNRHQRFRIKCTYILEYWSERALRQWLRLVAGYQFFLCCYSECDLVTEHVSFTACREQFRFETL